MNHLKSIECSFIQQHAILAGITQKLGLTMELNETGWVVRDPANRALLMTTRQFPDGMGALEDKLRRVFFQ